MEIIRKGRESVLERKRSGGVEYLSFPALEETGMVSHLFSTRLGGVSEGIYAKMNLSYMRGDKKEAVDENFSRIAKVLGRRNEDFVCSDQTHTTNIRVVTKKDKGKGIVCSKDYSEVDGLITMEAGLVLATFYADCVPLFIVDTVHRAIGLSHSGWRGTVGRMGECTLKAMGKAFGTRAEDVVTAIGPSICRDCYEVSEDVAVQFHKAFPEKEILKEILYEKGNGKYQLDLWIANYYIFKQAGVRPEKISITDICTCCNYNYLFSHRASDGKRGNLGAFLSIDRT